MASGHGFEPVNRVPPALGKTERVARSTAQHRSTDALSGGLADRTQTSIMKSGIGRAHRFDQRPGIASANREHEARVADAIPPYIVPPVIECTGLQVLVLDFLRALENRSFSHH